MSETKYRIREEKGNKLGNIEFYIQRRVKKLFGGYKWVYEYKYHPEGFKRKIEFDTLKKAEKWLDYETEYVEVRYHNYE